MQDFIHWINSYPLLFALFIIAARVVDVSIGTIRTIFVIRGYRWQAAALGFLEVIVWVMAVSGVLAQITMLKVIAYGLGFAIGNATGIVLEQKLAVGKQMIIIVSRRASQAVAFALRMANFRVTEIPARGVAGPVAMCFVVVPRARTNRVLEIVTTVDAEAQTVIEDVRHTSLPDPHATNAPTGWRARLKKK